MLTQEQPDLVFVPGGDGAILHAIQESNFYQVPFFGYACGTLNFLMNEVAVKEVAQLLHDIENNRIELSEISTTKIAVDLTKATSDEVIHIGEAVNEVVVGSTLMGYHSFVINSQDGSFNDFEIKGSGICISTDLGSTGYNFNLGGAILPLGSNLWSVLGIVCNRYLEDILNCNKMTINCRSVKSHPSVLLDGMDKKVKLASGDKLCMTKGDVVKIAFLNDRRFFEKRIDISSRFRKN